MEEWRSQKQVNKERGTNKENKARMSRRDFLRVAAGLGLAGGGMALGGFFAKRGLEELGLRFEERDTNELSSKDFFDEEAQILQKQTQEAPTQTTEPAVEATGAPEETPEPTSTPEVTKYFEFGNIDFENNEQIGMSYFLAGDQVLVPYFEPIIWHPEVLSSGEFDPEKNTGVVYLDSGHRKVLNLHSGRRGPLDEQGFSAYKLQIYLEEHPDIGVRRYPREVNEILQNILGSEVVLKQANNFTYSNIVAAARITPSLVNESKKNVYNINEWLAEKFPRTGFDEVLNEEENVLVVKFCGRRLAGEEENPNEPTYRQSRFFIATKLS